MKSSGLEPQARRDRPAGSSVSAEGTSAVQPRTTSEREPSANHGSRNSRAPADVRTPASPSRSGYTAAGERSAEAMRESHQAWADDQICTSSCAFCDWTFEGTVLEGREEALAHRQREHPEACVRKPRLRQRRISKRQLRTAGEEAQIAVDTAEARRLRHEREQSEMLAKIERGRERDRAALAALDVTA